MMRHWGWLGLALALTSGEGRAFPSMVTHNYGSCVACHVDPSGSGQLTPYGRAQADLLVRWRLQPRKEIDEVPRSAQFLWFLELPEALNLSGNLRSGLLVVPTAKTKFIPQLMSMELAATVTLGRFVFHGTGGLGLRNAVAPVIVAPQCHPEIMQDGQCGPSFVSREHWVGATSNEQAVMVRLGRMPMPFGLRNNEHTSFVRSLTKTDTNTGQQHGVAVAYNSKALRGEVMGILGNFQVGPDAYRERGYSAFVEYTLTSNAYVGLSSLVARALADPLTGTATMRHAHGLMARLEPVHSLALLAEGDFLAWLPVGAVSRVGFAALLQADFELMQGAHLIAMAEAAHTGSGEAGPSLGVWASAAWYALPHLEIRLDNILRRRTHAGGSPSLDYSLLLQFHVFL